LQQETIHRTFPEIDVSGHALHVWSTSGEISEFGVGKARKDRYSNCSESRPAR
jgi:hypothetical protein